jgi:hypothetical protein
MMNEIDTRNHISDPGYTMLGTCTNCLSQALVIYETGKEKRLMLKCPNCEGLHKFNVQPYAPSVEKVDGAKCACGGELSRIGGDFIMCAACNDAKVKTINCVSDLEAEREMMLGTLKLAYRKHCLGDESIGWEELDAKLLDTLCNVVGPEEYIKWAAEIKEGMG